MAVKPYYQDEHVTLYHGDCREVDWGPHDFLCTDPPFNVGKDYGTTKDALDDGEYGDMIASIVHRGGPHQGWVVPNRHWRRYATLLNDAQLVIVRRGAVGPIRWGWLDQFDLLMVKGKPLRPYRNLWDDIRLRGEGYFFTEESFGHPGYTPIAIPKRLISLMTGPGETVVDPFAGTGTTLRAAKDLGRRAIGIEIEEEYCELAVQRLGQEVLAL